MDRAERAELQRLMTCLGQGDRSAFHPVFVRLWPLVRAFVAQKLGPVEAEDVAQQALLRVFERAGQFDPRFDALSWVLGISAFEARTARRRAGRRREVAGDAGGVDPVDQAPTPEALVTAQQLEAAARAVMGELRPLDLQTLLALAEGQPAGGRGATFRKRVERALGRFRAAWRARHGA